jgi:hypothetical protein
MKVADEQKYLKKNIQHSPSHPQQQTQVQFQPRQKPPTYKPQDTYSEPANPMQTSQLSYEPQASHGSSSTAKKYQDTVQSSGDDHWQNSAQI